MGIDQPHAVGSEKPQAMCPGGLHEGRLAGDTILTSLLEPGRDDDGMAGAESAEAFDHVRHQLAGHHQHGQVRNFRQIFDVRIGFDTEDLGFFRVDGVDGTGKSAVQKVQVLDGAHLGGVVAGAYDGNGARSHDGLEGIVRHLLSFL